MQVIVTKSFQNDFLHLFKFQKLLDQFVITLKSKSHKLINLKYPYKKFKFVIGNISIRGVIFLGQENYLIPIFVVKKSDKQYGDNLVLNKEILDLLETKLQSLKFDIMNFNYTKY